MFSLNVQVQQSNPLLGGSYHIAIYWRCVRKAVPALQFSHICAFCWGHASFMFIRISPAPNKRGQMDPNVSRRTGHHTTLVTNLTCFILLYLLIGSDRWYSYMDNLSLFEETLRFLTVPHLNGKRSSSTTSLGQMKHGIELSFIAS